MNFKNLVSISPQLRVLNLAGSEKLVVPIVAE